MSSVSVKTPAVAPVEALAQLDEALRLVKQETRAVAPTGEPSLAALFDLVQRVLGASSVAVACRVVADGLKQLTGCDIVAVAVVERGRCRIEAVSHVDRFDRNAAQILRYEAACRSAIELLESESTVASGVVQIDGLSCLPFCDDRCVTAVCVVDGIKVVAANLDQTLELVRDSLCRPLVTRLLFLQQTMSSSWRRNVVDAVRRNRRLAWLIAMLATGVACLPLPYRVACDCELRPVVRRHIVAPFDGVLEKSLCKPGDVVAAGQTLARLDSKELTWDLASVTADRDKAEKSRDVNLSSGKTAASQIDRFEARRLDERRKLLEHRLSHLDVKSPIAGVIVSGDLDRAEGAPVKLGRSLFEVAPLDQMIVEVLIPETEIDHVRVGQEVDVSLDAVPGATRIGTLSRLYPRAEIRREANVFVAEVVLSNDDGTLRPGTKGRAAVRTDREPLAWIATHRLVESVYRWLW